MLAHERVEVDRRGHAVAERLVRTLVVEEAEVAAEAALGDGHVVVGVQVDLLVLHRAPQPLDEDVVFAEDRYWIYLIIERYTALLLKTPLYGYRANPISLTNEIDNARKLTIVELVNELIRQRKVRGSDWLSEGAFDKAMDFEQSLMKNKRWLSEQYRIFAATQIDLLKLHQAKKLLLTAYRLNPFNFSILRTLFYLLRRPCHSVRLNF